MAPKRELLLLSDELNYWIKIIISPDTNRVNLDYAKKKAQEILKKIIYHDSNID